MGDMWTQFLGGVVRHGLTTLAGMMISHGLLQSSQQEQFIGAGLFLGGIAWSWWQKSGHVAAITVLKQLTGKSTISGAVAAAKVSQIVPPPQSVLALFLGVAVLLSVLTPRAQAADLVTKAPVADALFTGYPYQGSGIYWGLASAVTSTTPTIDGVSATGLKTFGGSIGGVVGYQWGMGQVAYAVEGLGFWNNIGGSSTCDGAACSVTSRWAFEQRVLMMTPVSNLLNLFPALNLPQLPAMPTLPAGVQSIASNPYLMVAVHEDDISAAYGLASGRAWRISPGIGVGNLMMLSNRVALDVWGEYVPPGSGFSVGGVANANQGAQWRFGTAVKW